MPARGLVSGAEDGQIDNKQYHEDHHDDHNKVDKPLMLEPAELFHVLLERHSPFTQHCLVLPTVFLYIDAESV